MSEDRTYIDWAWSLSLSPHEKLVVVGLAIKADASGVSVQPLPDLAKRACMRPDELEDVLTTLKIEGYVELVDRATGTFQLRLPH